MSVSIKHLLSQGPVLRALGAAALSSLRPRTADTAIPATPGPWHEEIVQPRPPELIGDYLRNIGADPSWYRGRLPAHLFPQWGFPFAALAIAELPYPLTRVLNAGCRIEINHHLRDDEPFLVRARLESVDDDGRRALITTKIVSETVEKQEAIVSELRAYVPLSSQPQGASPRVKATVPTDARELAFLRLPANAGLDFAKLTGDFNPIHWIPLAARAAGFKGCILHGFGTLSRSIAVLDRTVFAGDSTRLKTIDARFTRPLQLPAKVGVYTRDQSLWVGDAPGGGAYLEATYDTR
jgi:hypothetical protein